MTRPRAKGATMSTVRHAAAAPPDDTPRLDQLLTVQDVSGQLKVDDKTVRGLIRSGRLRGYKVGREYRVHPGDVAAYLAAAVVLPPGQAQLA